jgi:hypothetical protein
MPVVGMRTNAYTISGSQIFTTDINFAPRDTFAIASLVRTSGGGQHACGIAGLRRRPSPQGAEVPENFGSWPNWRASAFRQRMTSVTFGMATGGDQTAKAVFTLYFFS